MQYYRKQNTMFLLMKQKVIFGRLVLYFQPLGISAMLSFEVFEFG